MSKAQRIWLGAAVAVLAAVVYGIALDRSPIYLTHDEVIYARNAYSIAATGRDLSGQFLPISIPVTGTFYATPANIYLTAAFLKVLPLSEMTVRLPSVLVGLLCVWLVYLIARRLLNSERCRRRRGRAVVVDAGTFHSQPARHRSPVCRRLRAGLAADPRDR